MKRIVILFCLVSIHIIPSCQTKNTNDQELAIPKKNQVILTQEEYFATKYELWIPTREQVDEALAAISTFLLNADSNNSLDEYFKSEIGKIIDNYHRYKVQFVGIIDDEKKYIHGNFFPANNNFPKWKEKLILVDDGGFWFWHIFYDVQSRKVRKIYINGYA